MTFFKVLPVGMLATNCYIISDDDSVLVIDPGFADQKILEAIRHGHLEKPKVSILLTHGHADHFMGADFIISKFPNASVYISEQDQSYLFDSNKNCARMFGLDLVLQAKSSVKVIKEGDIITCGKYKLKVVETPGHTPGGVVYIEESMKTVFSGDTLFNNGRGRTDFPGGSAATLDDSIRKKLFTLPNDYRVYPGHGDSTTIGSEK